MGTPSIRRIAGVILAASSRRGQPCQPGNSNTTASTRLRTAATTSPNCPRHEGRGREICAPSTMHPSPWASARRGTSWSPSAGAVLTTASLLLVIPPSSAVRGNNSSRCARSTSPAAVASSTNRPREAQRPRCIRAVVSSPGSAGTTLTFSKPNAAMQHAASAASPVVTTTSSQSTVCRHNAAATVAIGATMTVGSEPLNMTTDTAGTGPAGVSFQVRRRSVLMEATVRVVVLQSPKW